MSYPESEPLNPDLNFDFDLSGAKTDKDLALGSGPLPPGKYHVSVLSVAREDGDKPALKVVFTVLEGTTPGCKGRQIHEKLFLSEKAMPRAKLFASRLDLIPAAEFGKANVRTNWAQAVGRQAIVEIGEREYTKNDGSKGKASNITYGGIWRLADPEVAEVPKSGTAARHAQAAGAVAAGAAAATAAFQDL